MTDQPDNVVKFPAERSPLAKYTGGFHRYNADDVMNYAAELAALAAELGLKVSKPFLFGLALEIYDPISSAVITVVRPQRRDVGQSEVILNLDQARAAVVNARAAKLAEDRHLH
jgi:hypothetical protein